MIGNTATLSKIYAISTLRGYSLQCFYLTVNILIASKT